MDGQIGRKDAGFTLIELMIVVTILALLTTTLGLSLNRPSGDKGTDLARLKAMHQRLAEQAVLSRQRQALQIDEGGLQRLKWTPTGWTQSGSAGPWRGAVSILEPFDRQTPIEFTPLGQSTPIRVRFEWDGLTQICQSDGWSGLTCVRG